MGDDYWGRCRRALDAIREVEEADGRPPTAEDVAEICRWSLEYTYFLLHRLVEHGVLALIPSSFEDRYAVEDEDKLPSVPSPDDEPSVGEAEQQRRRRVDEQVQDIGRRFDKGFVDETRNKLFGDLQEKLAGRSEKRANPLDGAPPSPVPAADPGQQDLFSKLSEQLSGKTEKKANPLDALTKKKSG